MSYPLHPSAADDFDRAAGLTSTSRNGASQLCRQRRGRGDRPTRISGANAGSSERGQEQDRLVMDILERLGLLQGPGALGAPLNRSSNQDRREGERSDQRDQTELAILTQNNTISRAQAPRSYHRLRRGEKVFSSDEDDAEMCTGRMPAPSTHEHGRNESSMSLLPQNPLLVHSRGRNWTNLEDKLLIQARGDPNRKKEKSWEDIASNIPGRTGDQCRLRWDTLLRNYRKEHRDQGRSKEEYFDLLLSGRISCGQAESSQRDHLQERARESWKKRKTPEIDVAQDCHCKRERLFEVHETTPILQIAERILKIQERFLELKELEYERKTSGTEQATRQGDGLRAAGVGTTHWSSGQPNFVVPLPQEPVEQQFGAFPFGGCEEGVPQSIFNGI